MTLNYTGKDILVIDSWDGWAQIHYSDGAELGWVRSDYLLMDPAWYLCDEDTQVYAYPDFMSPCVALLDKGAKLPILTEWEDGESLSGWVCVSQNRSLMREIEGERVGGTEGRGNYKSC